MTDLESTTFADGFLLCLLETWQERPGAPISFQAKLFEGGRLVGRAEHFSRPGRVVPPTGDLMKLIYRVLPAPHILAGYGRGWKELLLKTNPEVLKNLRILDLYTTAIVLDDPLRPSSGTGAVAVAYGVRHTADEQLFFSETVENILWAVLKRAGERNLTWDKLLQVASDRRHRADFQRYDFDAATLASLPAQPGVYIMRDAGGRVLYVGKSANLARRLNEYFRDQYSLPPKVAALRDRIRNFEYRRVGSELEALLVENKLIGDYNPELNIQRTIREGGSRYPAPMLPVVVVAGSIQDRRVELFFFGGGAQAVQISANPFQAPTKSLLGLVAHFAGGLPGRIRMARGMTNWGAVGFEICRRHFMHARDRLHWKEVAASMNSPDGPANLFAIARKAIADPPPPGEYRDES